MAKEIKRVNMLKVKMMQTGSYAVNTYLITDTATGESAVIDIGEYDAAFGAFLRENDVRSLKYILLTHGHFDHICGAVPLKKRYGGEILIHEEDAVCLNNADYSLCNSVENYIQTETDDYRTFSDADEIFLGETKITVKHTPGHTKGSVMFFADGNIFSGDTLFRASMGRTDLPGGSTRTLFKSLREIGGIEGEYDIFPGHGEFTTLSYEKRNNRYLRANVT